MIMKLFSLFWALFTTKGFKYNWTNLWWYLTKGYYWTVQCERLDVKVYTRSMQSKKDAIETWNKRMKDSNVSKN